MYLGQSDALCNLPNTQETYTSIVCAGKSPPVLCGCGLKSEHIHSNLRQKPSPEERLSNLHLFHCLLSYYVTLTWLAAFRAMISQGMQDVQTLIHTKNHTYSTSIFLWIYAGVCDVQKFRVDRDSSPIQRKLLRLSDSLLHVNVTLLFTPNQAVYTAQPCLGN